MRHHKILLLVVALLGASVVMGWSMHRPSVRKSGQSPLPQVAIDLTRASIVLRHQGERQAEIHAERVEISSDLRYAAFVGNPTVVVYDRERGPLEVHGRTITLDRLTSEVTMEGPVELVSPRAGRLTAGAARWIPGAQRLVFEQGVTATLGRQKLWAEQVVITAGREALDLAGGVDVTFRLDGSRP